MADPNNEIKQPVDGDQPLPPDYNQPPVGYNPPAANYAPPPATMNPIAAQPTSMAPYPGLVMPARPHGAPHPGIPMLSHLDQNTLLPGQVAMLEALGAKQQVQWMMPPPASPGCPPGLECFTELDQISLAQQHNLVELVRPHYYMPIRYNIMNKFGQQVLMIIEEPLPYHCTCSPQTLNIRGYDANNKEVLRLLRPTRCGLCCCIPCISDCLEDMTVEAPTGNIFGSVVQTARIGPEYDILDSERNKILHIRGPFGFCPCYGLNADYPFQATDSNDQNMGTIVKHWAGMHSLVPALDRFVVNFAVNLDIKQKVLLMAASILIDFMFFQRQQPSPRGI